VIGPGHYDINRNPFRTHKGTNWHSSNVRREGSNKVKRASNYIGPGSYDINTSTIGKPKQIGYINSTHFGGKAVRKRNAHQNFNLMESIYESEFDSNPIKVNTLI